MAAQWHYMKDGNVHGPVSDERLMELAAGGRLDPQDRVVRDGMSDWVDAGSLLMLEFPTTPQPPPVAPQSSSVPTSTTTVPRRANPHRSPAIWVGLACAGVVLAVLVGWFARGWMTPSANEQQDKVAVQSNADAKKASPSVADSAASSTQSIANDVGESVIAAPVSSGGSSSNIPSEEPSDATEQLTTEPRAEIPLEGESDSSVEPKAVEPPAAQTEPPAKDEPKPVTEEPQPEKPTTLFQEIDVYRLPRFVIQGLPVAQEIRYRVMSELHVGAQRQDGTRVVEQIVLDTKLEKADDLSRVAFAESLAALKGQQFSFTLSREHEVLEFRGHKENRKALPVEALKGMGFQITSVMDEDGWKELAGLTFFLPSDQTDRDQTWKRQMTHHWGALGRWSGDTTFKMGPSKDGVRRYDYMHDMRYVPPGEDDGDDLPLEITAAEFKPKTAGGAIFFDRQAGRVRAAQEQFHVQGVVTASLLGQATRIQIEEQQMIRIQVFDQNPWQQ